MRTEITFAFCNMEVTDLSKNGYGLVLRVEVRTEGEKLELANIDSAFGKFSHEREEGEQ